MELFDPIAAQAAASTPATWRVDQPVGEAPQVVFRRVLLLRFPDPGTADRMVVTGASPALRGSFLALDYDALAPDVPALRATVTSGADGTVVAALDGPRRVVGADFHASLALGAGDLVDLYRLDGEVLAPEPSYTLRGFSPQALVQVGFEGISTRAGRVAAGGAMADGAEAGGAAANAVLAGVVAQEPVAFVPPAGFTDQRFALALRRGHAPVALGAADLARLIVRGLPTGPRLGLALPDRLDQAVLFWRADGQPGGDRPSAEGVFDAGAALAAALEAPLDEALERRRSDGGSGPIDIALVVLSDAPCRVRLDDLAIAHLFEIASFDDGTAKRILRFSGAAVEAQHLPLTLPAGVQVHCAQVRIKESLADHALGGGVPTAPPPDRRGRLLDGDTRVEQPLALATATTVQGVALALLPLRSDSAVALELIEDHRGTPRGRVLAELTFTLGGIAPSAWAVAALEQPIILSTAPYWLVARATAGATVWLETDASAPPATTAFAGGHRLLSSAQAGDTPSSLGVALAGHAIQPGSLRDDGSRTLDLTPTLRESVTGEHPPELILTAAVPGLVTVYPPVIRYQLPPT